MAARLLDLNRRTAVAAAATALIVSLVGQPIAHGVVANRSAAPSTYRSALSRPHHDSVYPGKGSTSVDA
ncbi:MAG: hypothetical protein JO246_07305, partial [Frankiaceae bacterium]|nr:hypothetical protein [Frankiaceae bacterium]